MFTGRNFTDLTTPVNIKFGWLYGVLKIFHFPGENKKFQTSDFESI